MSKDNEPKLDAIEILKIWHKVQGDTNLTRMLNGELTVHAYLRQVITSQSQEILELEADVAEKKEKYEAEKKEAEKDLSRKPDDWFLRHTERILEEARKTKRLALECLSVLRKES